MNGNNTPLVSIIVNCYNSERYLKETLESVLKQSYQNWEVVFWDNQSTDSSAAYFNSYKDSRFKYHYAPEHTPLSTARNLAVQKASGDFLAFLDCDDIWYKEKLQLQINSAVGEDAGIVYTRFSLLISSDDITAQNQAVHYNKLNTFCRPHPKKNLYKRLLRGNYIIFSSVLIKTSVFTSTGGFKNNLSQNEDYEILLKASLVSDAVCIDYIGVNYRIHASNNSHLNAEKNFLENISIFSSLPEDKELNEAKKRNLVKYGLFKVFMMNDIEGVRLLCNFHSFRYIFEILLKKTGYKFKMNAKE